MNGETLKFLLVNKAEDPELLYTMATKGTKDVTVIEMLEKIGKDFGRTTRWGMLQDVSRYGVKSLLATKALEINANGIKVDTGSGTEEIPADTVVIAVGARSNNALKEIIESKGIACEVAGDAQTIGMAFDAVHQGYKAGLNI
jgi:2,4-dienoyl-CoA reductase (NADPH2)